jgi:hypothetical protein
MQEKIYQKGARHEVQLGWEEIHWNRGGLDDIQGIVIMFFCKGKVAWAHLLYSIAFYRF